MWITVSSVSSVWNVLNPVESTWDAGDTQWDLNGNTYISPWDGIDTTYTDVTTTPTTWT